MFEKLDIFRMAHGLASHSAARQGVVAQNIANADTPEYAAKDIVPFEELWTGQGLDGRGMKTTRVSHLSAEDAGLPIRTAEAYTIGQDPNGNSVSLETEMVKAADIKSAHDRALAIYRSSLTIIRTSLGRA